ncbi:MAG TPA: isoprenylcysteine carboxylmethyltransferase family protein [Rhizomicrobium sp.]|nr:isoprenylcysteine carboxylmethyltransferase family protein [Rhizomicrobium sp.]
MALLIRLLLQLIVWTALMGALLFGTAGDWHWPQAWAFIAIFVFGGIGFGLWLGSHDPGLLAQRLGSLSQRGQPLWDRAFLICAVIVWPSWFVVMAFDSGRKHWSGMPVWLNVIGGILTIGGFLAVLRVFRQNSFAAPVIRVQDEREQRVIDTGPYAIVRHPMYAGALSYIFGIPLLLGSWVGLAMTAMFIAGIGWRAQKEEQLLMRDLSGYAAYMNRVRWRFIPYVW